MKNVLHILYIYASLLALMSCQSTTKTDSSEQSDALNLTEATLLSVQQADGYVQVDIADPWHKDKILASYALVQHRDSGQVQTPEGMQVVYVPLRRSVVATSAHCSLLVMLQQTDAIAGVCDAQFILNDTLRRSILSGEVADCGSSMNPSAERIVSLHADAMLMSPFEDNPAAQLSSRIGIPLIECADYMEPTPLARAEWMKFYGLLYGCEDKADSLFNVVRNRYQSLKDLTQNVATRPKVLTELIYQSVWYCPGGRSTKAQIIADAGGRYAFADNKEAGSLSLSSEYVVANASDADIWTFTSSSHVSLDQLSKSYKGYSLIRAMKQKSVFVCQSLDVPYFDEVSFRPDWHLEEYIRIIHPELLKEKPLRYYNKLKN